MDMIGKWPPDDARWTVRMLGRMEVASPTGYRPKFRSKSVQALLAYLTLNLGKDVSRFLLEETLWPDSDSNKQAQNLRRAVVDLRDALESEGDRGTVIETRRDIVCASPAHIASDADRFAMLAESGLRSMDAEALAEAISLYSGPLLAPIPDDWIYAYRLEFEERFGQCVEQLCQMRIAGKMAKEAIRIARTALLAAPNREDIHIALIHGYRTAGMESEALRQYEDLERMLDEVWGESPSESAREALNGNLERTQVKVSSSSLTLDSEPSGGAMSLTSRFYVRRPADDRTESCIDRGESVILVQGPRQVGKSSLLARSLAYARGIGASAVLTDFQTFGETQLADEERLYKTLAHTIATQLEVDLDLESSWSSWLGPNMNLDAILGKVLAKVDGRVCWAIDEADRVFGRSYANDFFGLLRSWHNRKALDPDGPWSRLTLVLAYATEAHLFITDLNQSPFNVGVHLPLRDFTREQVAELAQLYGVSAAGAIDAAYRTTQGHPFLTRRALAFLSQGGSTSELESTSALTDGPFGDHLRMAAGAINQDVETMAEVRRFMAGQPFLNPTTRYRLMASGVITASADSRLSFRVPAYEAFFRASLG